MNHNNINFLHYDMNIFVPLPRQKRIDLSAKQIQKISDSERIRIWRISDLAITASN